jgi:hypothetical protein
MVVGWPWLLGPSPNSDAASEMKLRYLEKSGTLIFGIVTCLVCAGFGAAMIARVAREEYSEMKQANLKELIEGTQSDIRGKHSDES